MGTQEAIEVDEGYRRVHSEWGEGTILLGTDKVNGVGEGYRRVC